MRELKISFIFLFLILFIFFNCSGQEESQLPETDIAAINKIYKQANHACSTGDAELYLSLFTKDAIVMAQNAPAIIGKEALRPVIIGLFSMFDLKLPYTINKIEAIKDNAIVRTSFQYSMTPKENGTTNLRKGKQLDIIKRQSDGSWKIYIQCWNFDSPQITE